jgi:integrase
LQYVWAGTRGEDTAISNSGRIVDLIGENSPIRGITTGTLRIAVKELEIDGLAPSTINRILGSMGKMLSVALEEKWIESRPKIPKVEEAAKEARFLCEEELDSLFLGLREVSPAAHDLAVFLLWTGCRVGEALSLEWGDIDLKAGRVTFTKTKTNHNRTVPVPARALKMLERMYAETRGFPTAHHKFPPFTIVQDTFGKQWNRAKQAIGMDDSNVTPHTLRHTCASRLVMAGVSLYEVAKWLGHTSITTTQVYAHLAPDHLKGAQDVLELKYGKEEETSNAD